MNKRNILACVLISIILFMLFLIIVNNDTIFKNKIDINYPDGCIETFVNNKLITKECTNGRKLLDRGVEQWIHNLNQT